MLGLTARDHQRPTGRRDDPRLDVIWATAGELKLPITIHIADPVAFFDPVDNTNERWEELHDNVDWQFPSPPFPTFLTIVNGLAAAVARHPKTTRVGAHVGCYAENLMWVGALLDRCPNFCGHQRTHGRIGSPTLFCTTLFLKYADRILFGTDRPVDENTYPTYYRFLETDDEYFDYGNAVTPRQDAGASMGCTCPMTSCTSVLQERRTGHARHRVKRSTVGTYREKEQGTRCSFSRLTQQTLRLETVRLPHLMPPCRRRLRPAQSRHTRKFPPVFAAGSRKKSPTSRSNSTRHASIRRCPVRQCPRQRNTVRVEDHLQAGEGLSVHVPTCVASGDRGWITLLRAPPQSPRA
ncbi:MAG: amidohydrolase family protein [Chloroflexi bacterium]|uniref:amidohydrolase family protein n=1 Tax=Candidatus Flexifilum breve TaxID=3140694 RepID=UPI003134846F|nr:amidohydrolase family protein [Chloroflexota bacterium]